MVDNGFMAAPEQVTTGTDNIQNTTDKPSKNNFNKEECGEIVDDKGDYYQEKCGEIVDNWSMAAPARVTIVAKHTQNNTDIPFNNNLDQ